MGARRGWQASSHLRSGGALAELAHSLKTPLAVLRSLSDGRADREEMRRTLTEQTARMHRAIDYQLQRAAASGPTLRISASWPLPV
jgi:two-component system sensor histidine kinase PhoQ